METLRFYQHSLRRLRWFHRKSTLPLSWSSGYERDSAILFFCSICVQKFSCQNLVFLKAHSVATSLPSQCPPLALLKGWAKISLSRDRRVFLCLYQLLFCVFPPPHHTFSVGCKCYLTTISSYFESSLFQFLSYLVGSWCWLFYNVLHSRLFNLFIYGLCFSKDCQGFCFRISDYAPY